jgi:hypothetical protein
MVMSAAHDDLLILLRASCSRLFEPAGYVEVLMLLEKAHRSQVARRRWRLQKPGKLQKS